MGPWTCTCGRSVPPQIQQCRCGVSRPQLPAPRTAPTGSDRSVLAGIGWLVLLLALGVGAHRWYRSYTPPVIAGLDGSSEPSSTSPPSSTAAQRRPAVAGAATVSTFEIRRALMAQAATPTPIPAAAPEERPLDPDGAEGVSETDQLRRRIDAFRAEYRPVKARVDELEREVADLSDRASRFIGGGNSGPATEGDAVHARLGRARNELDRARIALAQVEERARRAGVSYGQLY